MTVGKRLIITPNIRDADDFYERLLRAHEGLSDESSQILNTRLVLILANHIGDPLVLQDAIDLASIGGERADGKK